MEYVYTSKNGHRIMRLSYTSIVISPGVSVRAVAKIMAKFPPFTDDRRNKIVAALREAAARS